MVTVPAHAPAYVQQNLRQELEYTGDFISDTLGRVIVAGIQRQQLLSRKSVGEVKFVRADDVTFGPNTK